MPETKALAEAVDVGFPVLLARARDLAALTKPRIGVMVLFTAAVGFLLAAPAAFETELFAAALLGALFVSGGACALNMVMEREEDARMERTADRPVAAGRISAAAGTAAGAALSALGLFLLAAFTTPLAAALGAASLLLYLFAYTPLKKISSFSTLVGAAPGALPPVIGWAAAGGGWCPPAAALFAIQYLWQLPHFLAIAWRWRADLARGGFKVFPAHDPEGAATGRQAVLQTHALIVASLAPVFLGIAGWAYGAAALALGAAFLCFAILFALRRTAGRARRLFWASIAYLPALMGMMVLL